MVRPLYLFEKLLLGPKQLTFYTKTEKINSHDRSHVIRLTDSAIKAALFCDRVNCKAEGKSLYKSSIKMAIKKRLNAR